MTVVRAWRWAVAGGCLLALSAGPGLPVAAAAHAPDTEPPILSTPVKARFVVGGRLEQFRDNDQGHAYYDVPMVLNWSATDNLDDTLNFDVWEHPQAEEPFRVADYITATQFEVSGSDYDGFFGGAALVVDHWSVQAYDDAGNSVDRSVYGARLLVTQDNGRQTFGSASPQVRVRYAGQWSRGSCACFADKSVRRSDDRGAAVVVRVRVPESAGVRRIGLVLDRGPRQGVVHLVIDGEPGPRINLAAAEPIHRTIVWAGTLEVGAHVIRIVNNAPADRPRVAFDAVVTN